MATSPRALHHGGIADSHDARIETDATEYPYMAKPDSRARQPPALFHKVKNERSILALAVSEARLFAGTQSGEIL
ncbi:MAG: hypothetical protein L6R42_010979, partial [Xanthoria sp. 1 TBL-2021]